MINSSHLSHVFSGISHAAPPESSLQPHQTIQWYSLSTGTESFPFPFNISGCIGVYFRLLPPLIFFFFLNGIFLRVPGEHPATEPHSQTQEPPEHGSALLPPSVHLQNERATAQSSSRSAQPGCVTRTQTHTPSTHQWQTRSRCALFVRTPVS